MADESRSDELTIPPVWLDPMDVHILEYLRQRGPTYHINVSKGLGENVREIRRRCKTLTDKGLIDRRGHTFYGLTNTGESMLDERLTGEESSVSVLQHPESDD